MSPPLTPSADEARRQLAHELSNPVYTDPESWIEELYKRLIDWLTGNTPVSGPLSNGQLTALIVTAVILIAVVVWALLGPVRSRSRGRANALFDDDERTADQVRAEAEALAGSQQWSAAYLALFRAMIRTLAERGVITEFAGMTAQEAADLAGERLADFSEQLTVAAGVFDSLAYDHGTAQPEQYQRLAALDAGVATAQASAPSTPSAPAPVRVEATP